MMMPPSYLSPPTRLRLNASRQNQDQKPRLWSDQKVSSPPTSHIQSHGSSHRSFTIAPSPSTSKPASRSISRQSSQSKIQTTQPRREVLEPATEHAGISELPEYATTYETLPQPREQESPIAPRLEPSELPPKRYEPTPPPSIVASRHRPVTTRKETLKEPKVDARHDERASHVIFDADLGTVILEDACGEVEEEEEGEEKEGDGKLPLRDLDAEQPSEPQRIQEVANALITSEIGLNRAQSIMDTVYSSQFSLASERRAPSASVRRSLESVGAKGLRLDRVVSPTMALNKLPKTGSLGAVAVLI
ncbi:hypothetical protein BC830DRAFT_483889 [Chytriomyces sp. MP71]|nr:hypothetical protein BC830DRAFT_483889 [Chytriomyces sp. MP71]